MNFPPTDSSVSSSRSSSSSSISDHQTNVPEGKTSDQRNVTWYQSTGEWNSNHKLGTVLASLLFFPFVFFLVAWAGRGMAAAGWIGHKVDVGWDHGGPPIVRKLIKIKIRIRVIA